jgi:hypothetical protein
MKSIVLRKGMDCLVDQGTLTKPLSSSLFAGESPVPRLRFSCRAPLRNSPGGSTIAPPRSLPTSCGSRPQSWATRIAAARGYIIV